MVEWWQAVLIGLPPSVVAGSIGIIMQLRQQNRESAMQAVQFSNERQLKMDDERRKLKRSRLQPVFDLLDDIDSLALRFLWENSLKLFDEAQNNPKAPSEGGMTPEEATKVRQNLVSLASLPDSSDQILGNLLKLKTRLSDTELFEDIHTAAMTLLTPKGKDLDYGKFAVFHERLEQETVRLDDS